MSVHATHLERVARQLKGAANSCTRAKARDTLSEPLRDLASVLRRKALSLLTEAKALEESARQHRIAVRSRVAAERGGRG